VLETWKVVYGGRFRSSAIEIFNDYVGRELWSGDLEYEKCFLSGGFWVAIEFRRQQYRF
jgi:hypothetical protein